MEAENICLGWCELVVGLEYDGVLGWRAELAELQERLGGLFGRRMRAGKQTSISKVC